MKMDFNMLTETHSIVEDD